jgi:hypothetical protein
MLYQKGGNTAKAVELCFRSRLFDQLREIAETLPADADPFLIHRCAEFFLDHGQYEKTVRLFSIAGEYAKALDLCVLHSVYLSEEMAEKLCPEVGERGVETDEARVNLLLKVRPTAPPWPPWPQLPPCCHTTMPPRHTPPHQPPHTATHRHTPPHTATPTASPTARACVCSHRWPSAASGRATTTSRPKSTRRPATRSRR